MRHRETTATSFSEQPQITALPGFGTLMENGQHSAMRCTRVPETRDADGGVGLSPDVLVCCDFGRSHFAGFKTVVKVVTKSV